MSTNDYYEHIDIRKVGGNIGAEVSGVSLSGELAAEVVAETGARC